jgi:hypothetical protein
MVALVITAVGTRTVRVLTLIFSLVHTNSFTDYTQISKGWNITKLPQFLIYTLQPKDRREGSFAKPRNAL